MTLHGPSYPSSTTLEVTPQELVLNLLCATEVSEPGFKSYDGNRAVVEWSAPPGCSFRSEAPAEEGDKTPEVEAVSSGIGWFFLLFVLYFTSERDKFLTWTTPRLLTVFCELLRARRVLQLHDIWGNWCRSHSVCSVATHTRLLNR
jgi:Autophagy-related protein 27